MQKETKMPLAILKPNTIDSREGWLREATNRLRPMFDKIKHPLPENIRFAIAFPSSGRKGQRVSETWHSEASADGSYEIILRADLAEPLEVISALVRELVHAALPEKESHGKRYKAVATKIGLEGKMRAAVPGALLQESLSALAAEMPPLPHAALDINWKALSKPKKPGVQMLKAECRGKLNEETQLHELCGYTVRLLPKWATEYGASCPKHGTMHIEFPEEATPGENQGEAAGQDHAPVPEQDSHQAVVEVLENS